MVWEIKKFISEKKYLKTPLSDNQSAYLFPNKSKKGSTIVAFELINKYLLHLETLQSLLTIDITQTIKNLFKKLLKAISWA